MEPGRALVSAMGTLPQIEAPHLSTLEGGGEKKNTHTNIQKVFHQAGNLKKEIIKTERGSMVWQEQEPRIDESWVTRELGLRCFPFPLKLPSLPWQRCLVFPPQFSVPVVTVCAMPYH